MSVRESVPVVPIGAFALGDVSRNYDVNIDAVCRPPRVDNASRVETSRREWPSNTQLGDPGGGSSRLEPMLDVPD